MPPVRFIITGFGPFQGVDDNPTQRLLAGRGAGSLAAALAPPLAARVVSTAVLRVSAAAARAWAAEHAADEGGGRPTPPHATTPAATTVFLHLGVNAQHHGGGFALEEAAYNCADFRVPDVDGVCGGRACIVEGVGMDAVRTTGLPLGALVARLYRAGWAAAAGAGATRPRRPWWAWWQRPARRPHVRISSDAGRYLCNFVYFLSLRACGCGEGGEGPGGRRARREALFVHVPPADVVPLSQQAAFLADLLQAIVDEVGGGDELGV